MNQERASIDDLDQKDLVVLIFDFFHRLIMHHGMWYDEVQQHLGPEKTAEIWPGVFEQSSAIHLKRLSKVLGFELEDGIPKPLLQMPRDKLIQLKDAVAANWLANDGVWFQAVEFSHNMSSAKKCNDACWSRFSPMEAGSIKKFLNLGKQPGLEGLKRALQFRLYASLNEQSVGEESGEGFTFYMNQCRVQGARQRKGLDDYPCKSAGIIEYSTFAESIDNRIKTQCVACPPDEHPAEWFCAWRFQLENTDS